MGRPLAVKLTDKQKALLDCLKAAERRGTSVTVPDLVTCTGLAETSVHTYIGKKLVGRYLHKTEVDGRYTVRGVLGVSDQDFAAVMTQRGSVEDFEEYLTHLSKPEWERAAEVLVDHGVKRGFDATKLLERLLDRLA